MFSSFIRQLNLYDFHKIKSKDNNNTAYEFTNVNFLKNNPEKMNLIKRKTKNDNMANKNIRDQFQGIKGNELVIHSPRKFLNFKIDDKKLNLNKMHKKALKLSEIVSNLRKKNEILEGKYDFLEFCNNEVGEKNKNITNNLQKILDKKKTLENLFFYMIRNFFPNIKLIENSLPDSSLKSSIQTNNQISDLRNNEIISQIYKIFNLSDNNLSNNNISTNNTNNIISNNIINNNLSNKNILNNINIKNNNDDNYNKIRISQLMDQIIDKDQSNIEAREINTYNKIIDFQKKYFTDLDDQFSSKSINLSFDNKSNQDNNSMNISRNDNNKNEKDLLTVTSNNNSTEIKNNQYLSKKIARDVDNTISDGSKDLL